MSTALCNERRRALSTCEEKWEYLLLQQSCVRADRARSDYCDCHATWSSLPRSEKFTSCNEGPYSHVFLLSETFQQSERQIFLFLSVKRFKSFHYCPAASLDFSSSLLMFLSRQQPAQALPLTPCCLAMITLLLFTNKPLWNWDDKRGVQGSTLIANGTCHPWSNFTTRRWVALIIETGRLSQTVTISLLLCASRKYLDSPCSCGNTSLGSLSGETLGSLSSQNLCWVGGKITTLVLTNIVLFCEVLVKHLRQTGLGVLSLPWSCPWSRMVWAVAIRLLVQPWQYGLTLKARTKFSVYPWFLGYTFSNTEIKDRQAVLEKLTARRKERGL